jgi:hypothetical protein
MIRTTRRGFAEFLLAGWLLAAPATYAQTATSAEDPRSPTTPPRKLTWAPPDIDEAIPPVEPAAKCSLPEILRAASARQVELLTNLDRFTATEQIEYLQVNRKGDPLNRSQRSYNYVVSLREIRPGYLTTEEYRNGREGAQFYFNNMATNGLPSLVMIFHPYYAGDFEMVCEGLGQVNGEPAWQVHFLQRPDRPSRMYGLRVGGRHFALGLRGRAWISPSTGQVLRLEADITKPVPEAGMKRSHKIVEYQPVHFEKQKIDLWLPARAEVYMDFRGQCFQIRHSFNEFLLFEVTTQQKMVEPKLPPP